MLSDQTVDILAPWHEEFAELMDECGFVSKEKLQEERDKITEQITEQFTEQFTEYITALKKIVLEEEMNSEKIIQYLSVPPY